jgi:hypothetical protein
MTTTAPRRSRTAAVGIRVVRHTVTAVALLALYFLVPTPDTPERTVLTAVAFLTGLALLAAYVVALVRRARTATATEQAVKIESLVLLLYAVIVFFSLIYLRLAQTPGEMVGLSTRIDAMYFTMTTLATVGFGDISAIGQTARLVVTIQMVFDVAVLGVAAKLIGSAVAARPRAARNGLG